MLFFSLSLHCHFKRETTVEEKNQFLNLKHGYLIHY